jgi:hypothetical protein
MAKHYTHSEIVQLVATAKELEKQAKAADELAKEAIAAAVARSPSVSEWSSEAGTVQRTPCKGRETLDKAKVAAALPPAVYAACISKGADYFQVKFKPNLAAVIQFAKAV